MKIKIIDDLNEINNCFIWELDYIIVVVSDKVYNEKFIENLQMLKTRFISLLITKPTEISDEKRDEVEQVCIENNISILLDNNQQSSIQNFVDQNVIIENNYEVLAKYYVQLQPQINYIYWFKNITFENKSVVDLGCGVPEYLNYLKPTKYLGIDISAQMITLARNKYKQNMFKVGNILTEKYNADVVISLFDVINYLPTISEVQQLFANVFQNLNNNGLFIFDIHHECAMDNYRDYFYFEENENEQFIWESQVVNNKLIHYFQVVDDQYKVHIEKHIQTFYDKETIIKLLKVIGFDIIELIHEYDHYIIKTIKKGNNE